MKLKPCLVCGRPSPGPRCPEHRIPDRRGTRQARGYDEDWRRRVAAAIRRQPWCSYCGTPGTPANPLTGDHPVPLARGGGPDQEPIVACRRCNSRRGARVGGGA